jgi:hypothetical protein
MILCPIPRSPTKRDSKNTLPLFQTGYSISRLIRGNYAPKRGMSLPREVLPGRSYLITWLCAGLDEVPTRPRVVPEVSRNVEERYP